MKRSAYRVNAQGKQNYNSTKYKDMKIHIDEIRSAEMKLEDINEEIREARFHHDKEREAFMLKEKRETLKFLALAEKENA